MDDEDFIATMSAGVPPERNVDDEFPDVTDPRDPDLPAPEGWQLPAREIRF